VNYLVIEEIRPYDGRYEFDLDGQELTTREWGHIKRLSGYLPLTMQQGVEGADPELFCAFAVVALCRANRIENTAVQEVFDRLADAPFGATIRLEADEPEETDADPPVRSSNGSSSISGDGSRTSSESSDTPRSRSGTPGSATSASVSPTLVT
jgi:hypothetical protein